jgi:7-keto-8-aminopelargonate synthetase-like enzyme
LIGPVEHSPHCRTLDRFGSGSCGARLVNGTTTLHQELEAWLAAWLGTESALTFSSGYMANLGAISAMCDSETVIITDQLNHMSIQDGCRLAESRIKIFSHNNVDKLEYIPSATPTRPSASSWSTASTPWTEISRRWTRSPSWPSATTRC